MATKDVLAGKTQWFDVPVALDASIGAKAELARLIAGWGTELDRSNAMRLLSEVVTVAVYNAGRSSQAPVRVAVRVDHIRLYVSAYSAAGDGVRRWRGRGLPLIDRLSETWSVQAEKREVTIAFTVRAGASPAENRMASGPKEES